LCTSVFFFILFFFFGVEFSIFSEWQSFFRLSCCILHENFVAEGQGRPTMLSGGVAMPKKERGADRTGTGQLGRKVSMKAKFIVAAQSKCKKRAGDIRCTRILCGNSFPFCFVCGKVFPSDRWDGGGFSGSVGGKFMFMMCVPERCFWYACLR